MPNFTTPMMMQYAEIKNRYPDCLLFFRLGDFYELFLEDAKIGSEILGITLTGRPKGKDGRIPMAGVPYHAVDSYLNKLVKAGYKVAICEQLSEPDKKGIVERDVIRVVTPGTIMDERALEKKTHNYILSLAIEKNCIALALADFSTGQLQTEEYFTDNWQELLRDELIKTNPTECILPDELYNDPDVLKILKTVPNITIFLFSEWKNATIYAKKELRSHFGVNTLEAFQIENKPLAQKTCNALLTYLKSTQKNNLPHINSIVLMPSTNFVLLDRATIINLELFSTIREQNVKGSLLTAIDYTHTAMGGRLLKDWLVHPLKSKKHIETRLNAVDELLHDKLLLSSTKKLLSEITDIERTFSRVSVGIGNARDLAALSIALHLVMSLKHRLVSAHSSFLLKAQKEISPRLTKLINLIDHTLVEEPPIQLKEGGIIRDGVDKTVDELRRVVNDGRTWVAKLEAQERAQTGIGSLKIRYNQVFGYFIEISKSNLSAVPSHYFRKQTLVNGERFITEELKTQEETILKAEELLKAREYELYKELLLEVIYFAPFIQLAAVAVARVDCITSGAICSKTHRYNKPKIVYSHELVIKEGRHPVVEQVITQTQFVPNNTQLGSPTQSVMLLTGPNMAGKSVYLRQVAVITLLAHIGSFVPAKSAYIPIVDSIFVRSGASDMISSGLSTFMVEMVETAFILNHATPKSLIVMDEIGRGTSTYDGVSIAWAVAEYFMEHFNPCPKTLFATHYHELIDLEKKYPTKLRNAHMNVLHAEGGHVFTHSLVSGPAYESYGIDVAKLAGVPASVITRANALLNDLHKTQGTVGFEKMPHQTNPYKELEDVDLNNTTPLQALQILSRIKLKT